MTTWLMLIFAVFCEVFGALSLKASDGFSKPPWVLATAVGYGVAFYLFSIVVKTIPLGLAYTVWAGLGCLGTFVTGILVFGETMSLTQLFGAAVVVLGIFMMNAASV